MTRGSWGGLKTKDSVRRESLDEGTVEKNVITHWETENRTYLDSW